VAGRLFLGTSGFAYPEWKGEFYPPDIRSDAMLGYYASRFPSVEINYTHQREVTSKMLERWSSDTPEGFVFAVKAHRRITHDKRLGPESIEPLEQFLSSVVPLGSRLGPVLFQCPPNFKIDLPRLRAFLGELPLTRRCAFEFRHPSWREDAVKEALRQSNAGWVVADTDDYDAPFERTSARFAYLRLRKSSYDGDAIAGWAKEIGAAIADGIDVYCYLMHEDSGRCAGFARALQEAIARDQAAEVPGNTGGPQASG
jgi:uncharacterized protein YecE (DUF72 family)